jgi:hypothetical protein
MATERTIALPLANYPSGTHVLTERALPDWATAFAFEVARCTAASPSIWPNDAATLDLSFEVEVGGVWSYGGGVSARGGIVVNPERGELALCRIDCSLPAGSGRKIRGSVTIANGPLHSEGTIELSGG